MALPNMCIPPCEARELAPDEPLCAPADHLIRVWRHWRLRTYLVRHVETVEKDVYGRKFFAIQCEKTNSPTLFASFLPDENLAHTLKKVLARRFYQTNWTRYLYFDESLTPCTLRTDWKFCLVWKGPWHIFWRKAWDSGQALFRLDFPTWRASRWQTVSCDEWSQWVIQQLQAPESDCAFALRWLQMTMQEKNALLFPVLRGTRAECDHILRLILQVDSQIPIKPSESWVWNIPVAKQDQLDEWDSSGAKLHYGNERGEMSVSYWPLTERQTRLLELVVRHFGMYWKTLNGQYTAAYLDRDGRSICLVPPLTTQHERLEAGLQLRDWLQGKVAPEAIPFLLGES